MNPKILIAISVVLSAVAQICLKHGLNRLQTGLSDCEGVVGVAFGVVRQGFIWLWGLCFVLATVLWLLGLQKVDLSYAYPLVSFGYVLVSLLSMLVFHERVDRHRWTAIAVLSLGVVLIARS